LGAFGIIFIRGIVVVSLYHSLSALVVVLASGIGCYVLARRAASGRGNTGPQYQIKDYSYAELAIDCAVLLSAIFLYSKVN